MAACSSTLPQNPKPTSTTKHKRIMPLKIQYMTIVFGLICFYRTFVRHDFVGDEMGYFADGVDKKAKSASMSRTGMSDQAEKGSDGEDDRRGLAFLHIPKTGGSSIVAASVPHKLSWGDCMFRNYTKQFHCSEWAYLHRPCPAIASKGIHVPSHTPIQYLHLDICNPYEGRDVFVVVRNPYDRWLSEYYYYCTKMTETQCDKTKLNDREYMNKWIQKRLKLKQKCDPEDKCYTRHANHEIAQYDFVYDTRNRTEPQRLVK
mmetsp:Transcript_86613/g.250126  ORF Transcript_86613/g.250126 Transcript_86613/m.250126 type:complete len:260 (-) Transcript_86613:8-787(-)